MSEAFCSAFPHAQHMARHWLPEELMPGHRCDSVCALAASYQTTCADQAVPRREAVTQLMWQNAAVVEKLMAGLALCLGLPEDYFRHEMDPRHSSNKTAMVLPLQLCYEQLAQPRLTLSACCLSCATSIHPCRRAFQRIRCACTGTQTLRQACALCP